MPGGVFQCDECYPDCPPPICEGILKESRGFPQKSGNSRDFRTFSSKFPGFSGISQVTIFGLKPYPRGSGAWKQPQQSIFKVGLHRIPWFLWAGSLPDVDNPWPSPASQVIRPPSPPLLKTSNIPNIRGIRGVRRLPNTWNSRIIPRILSIRSVQSVPNMLKIVNPFWVHVPGHGRGGMMCTP